MKKLEELFVVKFHDENGEPVYVMSKNEKNGIQLFLKKESLREVEYFQPKEIFLDKETIKTLYNRMYPSFWRRLKNDATAEYAGTMKKSLLGDQLMEGEDE